MHLCEAEILIPVISENIVAARTAMVSNECARPVDRLIDVTLFKCSKYTICQIEPACPQQFVGWLRVLCAKEFSFGIRPELQRSSSGGGGGGGGGGGDGGGGGSRYENCKSHHCTTDCGTRRPNERTSSSADAT